MANWVSVWDQSGPLECVDVLQRGGPGEGLEEGLEEGCVCEACPRPPSLESRPVQAPCPALLSYTCLLGRAATESESETVSCVGSRPYTYIPMP